jgi:oligopeptidase B
MHPPLAERRLSPDGDDYAWLRAENWQQVIRDPSVLPDDIRRHLEAENAYLDAVLAPVAELRETLYAELRARLPEVDASVPQADGPWHYFTRFVAGGEYPIHCRRPREGGEAVAEEVLVDGNLEAAAHGFYRLGSVRHSPDHRRLAYTEDVAGSELYALRIKDLESGGFLDAGIGNAAAGFAWVNDSATLYYAVYNENHRPYRILRHCLGMAPADDEIVYEENDPAFFLGVDKTESGRFVLIRAHDHSETSEVLAIDAERPEAGPVSIAPRRRGVSYGGGEWRGRFVLRTNADGAEDFKIVEAPVETPGPEHWRELVPHRPGTLIVEMLLFDDWLVRRERVAGLPRLVVRRLADGSEHAIAFDEAAYELSLLPGLEFRTESLRFVYSSPATPQRTFDYDMGRRERKLRKEQRVPSGHDPTRYIVERIAAPGHDGTPVPVTILRRKDVALDGRAPLWLYGYGAYGISMPASFSTDRLSLVERGFVFAIAHVRGGMEGGFRWYREGKLAAKRNTFLDFIAAAEALIAARYTSVGNIVAQGRSAGGMLVGAAINMRPDLFLAASAEVPFVDVLNTMSDAELPLTPPEWDEWGNPIEDAAARARIAGYCPYTNIRPQDYPHVLATGGLTDPRVTYWEPTKWVAKLRALRTDGRPTLLHMNMEAGHAGSAGRFQRLRETALVHAFALLVAGKAGS